MIMAFLSVVLNCGSAPNILDAVTPNPAAAAPAMNWRRLMPCFIVVLLAKSAPLRVVAEQVKAKQAHSGAGGTITNVRLLDSATAVPPRQPNTR
jgi:hypothetical protein